MSSIVYWSVALIVLFIGGFLTYENITQAIKAKNAKEEFLRRHRDGSLKVLTSWRMYLFAFLALLCLGCLFAVVFDVFNTEEQSKMAQVLTYTGLFLFCAAMAVESYTLSRVAVCQEGFMVIKDYIRFKTIREIVTPGGFMKSPELILTTGSTLQLPKDDIKLITPLWQEYRENRGNKKNRKKRNG